MDSFRLLTRLAVVALVMAIALGTSYALTDEEIFRDFRFNLINPGARSLALGGAFISLADDATAAQANPAGLSFLIKAEYFLEGRTIEDGNESQILGEELPAGINTTVATGTGQEDVQNFSFASVVIPLPGDHHWTLAFSRQEVLNTSNKTLNTFVFTFEDAAGISSVQGDGSIDVLQTNWNASAGFRVNDRLAFGGSVSFARLSVDSEVENFIVDTATNLSGMEILEPTLESKTRTNDSDTGIGFTLGVLYKPIEKLSLGAVYRRAPKFEVTTELGRVKDPDCEFLTEDCPGSLDIFGLHEELGDEFPNEFNFPDSYGVGISWQPNRWLTLALDVEHIEYSDLVEGFVSGVNTLTDFDAEFTVDDATEVRVGAEYVLRVGERLKTVAVRAGFLTESDNAIRASDTGTVSFASEESFAADDDEKRFTTGVGLNWENFTLDVAAGIGDGRDELLVSFIYRGK